MPGGVSALSGVRRLLKDPAELFAQRCDLFFESGDTLLNRVEIER